MEKTAKMKKYQFSFFINNSFLRYNIFDISPHQYRNNLHISKEKILSEKENSKNIYGGLGKQIFFEAYYREKAGAFENYDYLSFFAKSDDEDYIIQAIYAVKYYLKDIDKCYIQHNEVVAELGNIFKNEKKQIALFVRLLWGRQ